MQTMLSSVEIKPAAAGGDLDPGYALPPPLAASWARSARYGLRRQDRLVFNSTVSAVAGRRIAEESRLLMRHANPEMLSLYKGLGSANWLALCANARGEIVCFAGDRAAAPQQLRALMQPGRVVLEAEVGTTAPGCALEDRVACVVSHGEHFLLELQNLFCASAPILAPDGQLAGVLDITGVDVRTLPLASDLVSFAVRRIENGMMGAIEDCDLLRFHLDERLLGTPFEAIIAVDSDGMIKAANRAARQVLSLQSRGDANVALEAVFEFGLEELMRRANRARGEPFRINTAVGSFAFVNVGGRAVSAKSQGRSPRADQVVVEDPSMVSSCEKATRILCSGLPVILQGETGTGKEVFARLLHHATRPRGPFLAINCVAIPEGLIEAQLFGYADGAFTGGRRGGAPGVIEEASGGTLLLDEIGDMPPALQCRLLRVLQNRTVTRIGETREIAVDINVVCATHRDLEALVSEGRFREDLYYRLNGYTMRLPPLRERADINSIIEALFRRWSGEGAEQAESELHRFVSPQVLESLARYSWPGNIRQLEQVIRSMLALRKPGTFLEIGDLAPFLRAVPATAPAVPKTHKLEAIRLEAIRKALDEHGGNVSLAAQAIGISRGTVYNVLKRSGLSTARSKFEQSRS